MVAAKIANILQAGSARPEGGGENQITPSTRMGISAEVILLWGRDVFSLAIHFPPLSFTIHRSQTYPYFHIPEKEKIQQKFKKRWLLGGAV
jgi:hypothetical protein